MPNFTIFSVLRVFGAVIGWWCRDYCAEIKTVIIIKYPLNEVLLHFAVVVVCLHRHLLLTYGSSDDLSADEKKLLAIKGSTTLDEVVITAPKKPVKDYFGKANTSGVCNDYVCHLGFLNCKVHPAYATLVDGQKCYIETGIRPQEITYHCEYKTKEPYIKELVPILPDIAYIPFNPDEVNLPETLENTTLHWQALVVTDDNGEATMSFYSNERKGNFRAIAQGITDKGVFSAELQFVVGVD